jgi:mono/diheme cytochrome c family protein
MRRIAIRPFSRLGHRPDGSPVRYHALLALAAIVWLAQAGVEASAEPSISPADREFFEKHVRPVLVANCVTCHGPEKQKGGLRADSRDALLAGGDSGPAVVPGDVNDGYLISAINYGETYQMPPKGKLKAADIAALSEWVKRGAPWPAGDEPAAAKTASAFDLKERAKHWAFQPLKIVPPPQVKQTDWPKSPIDPFILRDLQQAGLKPAAPADKRTLLRRVTYDLIGLPPTPAEIEAFLADESPEAFGRVVDRLLASPHYGERQARHWLDLARFAETYGHEYDFVIPQAFRYRDYCIRAFNADLPYDQFMIEQIAGDLLPHPRTNPADGTNESATGTAFFCFGEQLHAPVDVLQAQADRIDNQIDVFGKTFLAMTLACARCHDHKFDAISTRDYYGLYGFLKSSRTEQCSLEPAGYLKPQLARLQTLKASLRAATAKSWREAAEALDKYLLAAWNPNDGKLAAGLNPALVQRWTKALADPQASRPEHPLFPLAELRKHSVSPSSDEAARILRPLLAKNHPAADPQPSRSSTEFNLTNFDGWSIEGDAFGAGAARVGDFVPGKSQPIEHIVAHESLRSDLVSRRLEGSLQTPSFTIRERYLHVHAAGKDARIRVVVDGFVLIRSPIYGSLHHRLKDDQPHWITIDLEMWRGHRAYLEFVDLESADPADPSGAYGPDGYLAVDRVLCSEQSAPPTNRDLPAWSLLKERPIESLSDLSAAYRSLVLRTIDDWQSSALASSEQGEAEAALLNWLVENKLLDPAPAETSASEAAALVQEYRRIEATLAKPRMAFALIDGDGENSCVFIRGNPANQGPEVPRRFLEVFDGPEARPLPAGSGRLELAQRMLENSRPLVARVIVNRLWLHHFGEGLVRSPDDFGRMGQTPTHPELLDYLASELMRRNWSLKEMHRVLLLSSTYQMSSHATAEAKLADPSNNHWHHVPVRRLEAESIRDAILAVSGRLDRTMYGPSVMPFISPFMHGRGRPGNSGPLDGAGRRSIYVGVRRNFLTPMFQAFDYPTPFSTRGQRSVSHVPAQALAMMNNPFVIGQAKLWGEQILREPGLTTPARIDRMYLSSFGRPPTADESRMAVAFIDGYDKPAAKDAADAWADLAHVLMNLTEFIFVY